MGDTINWGIFKRHFWGRITPASTSGSVVVVCSWSPESRATACPLSRQKLHLSSCADFRDRLSSSHVRIASLKAERRSRRRPAHHLGPSYCGRFIWHFSGLTWGDSFIAASKAARARTIDPEAATVHRTCSVCRSHNSIRKFIFAISCRLGLAS